MKQAVPACLLFSEFAASCTSKSASCELLKCDGQASIVRQDGFYCWAWCRCTRASEQADLRAGQDGMHVCDRKVKKNI